MRIMMALSSVGRAFAYLVGVRPRVLVRKFRGIKPVSYNHSKLQYFSLQRFEVDQIRSAFKNQRFSLKLRKKNFDDLRSVLEVPQEGPISSEHEGVKCKYLHRVSIRSVLQAVSTTESIEVSGGELDMLNTTHSSIVESDDLALIH